MASRSRAPSGSRGQCLAILVVLVGAGRCGGAGTGGAGTLPDAGQVTCRSIGISGDNSGCHLQVSSCSDGRAYRVDCATGASPYTT
jgi:hypothetical protein